MKDDVMNMDITSFKSTLKLSVSVKKTWLPAVREVTCQLPPYVLSPKMHIKVNHMEKRD